MGTQESWPVSHGNIYTLLDVLTFTCICTGIILQVAEYFPEPRRGEERYKLYVFKLCVHKVSSYKRVKPYNKGFIIL